ncbi:MAG: TolC family protein [Treponema sp.]|nr:TolC family protein [Treponema sp.]
MRSNTMTLGGNARYIKTLIAAVILSLSSVTLFAREEPAGSVPMRLTPGEAVELAIRNNLALEASRISTDGARRAANLSWNQFIPSVDVGGALFRLNNVPEGIDFGIPGVPPMGGGHRWGLAGSVSASLSLNLAMFADMGRLRLDFERGLVSYGKARAQLERDVRKLYHNALLLQEHVALLHGSLETAERQVQIAQANFTAGLASELTVLQAQVARENMRPVIEQAEGGLQLLMMQFAMFLGLPPYTDFELAPIPTVMTYLPMDTAELVRRAAAGQPDVQALRQDILVMNSIRRSGRLALFTPTVTLGWNADPTFDGDPWEDSWTDGDRWNQQQGAFSVSVGFRLNGLLPFGGERQGLRALDDQIRIANIGLAQMIRGTEIEIHNLVRTLERIKLSMEALEQTVTLAERSFDLTEQAYRAGAADFFQVQNAELSLRQARAQLSEQQFNYLNGLLDLEYALGVPFGTLTSDGSGD